MTVIEVTDIDKRVTFRVEYTYYKALPAIGSPAVVQAEPHSVEIHSVTVHGAAVMYHKPLWDELSERVLEDYCDE
jgi:hypothetical protein